VRITEIPNFDKLSDQDRIALADEILGSLRHPDALPPPLALRAELDRRWAAYEANPCIALNREQFRAQVAVISSASG
jgi:putative addiction module component (TIGR02574 family)